MIEESKAKKDYFLLLKINIPFFNENEFAPYSDCFELMDIPGLSTNSNFYINELFPYFINNAKFCIFLFDAENIIMMIQKLFLMKFQKNLKTKKTFLIILYLF